MTKGPGFEFALSFIHFTLYLNLKPAKNESNIFNSYYDGMSQGVVPHGMWSECPSEKKRKKNHFIGLTLDLRANYHIQKCHGSILWYKIVGRKTQNCDQKSTELRKTNKGGGPLTTF